MHKYKEEYKQGEMWHSPQRAEISEENGYICMSSLGIARQRVHDSSPETNNEELLIARQRFRNHGYIDGNNWSWDK
jgi:hypothetical protein